LEEIPERGSFHPDEVAVRNPHVVERGLRDVLF
jgi:hypothetical protein